MPNDDLRENVNAVLSRFGDGIGLQRLGLDENNNCLLSIDDSITVNIQLDDDGDKLILFTDLGRLSEANRLEICEALLEANLFWGGTDGATVGLERSEGLLFLCDKTEPAKLTLETFEALLERFINTAEDLTGLVRDLRESASQGFSRPMPGSIKI